MQLLRFVGIGLLSGYGLLTFLIFKGQLVSTDFDVLVKIQDNVSPRFDSYLHWFVTIGSIEITSIILLLLLFLLPLKFQSKILICVLFVIGLLSVLAGKEFLHHPAPTYRFHRDQIGLSFPSSYVHSQYSYPSGHTYRTLFIASLLVWYALSIKNLTVRMVLLGMSMGFAGSVPFALLVLGKHWATDVWGGALLASGIIGVFSQYFVLREPKGNI